MRDQSLIKAFLLLTITSLVSCHKDSNIVNESVEVYQSVTIGTQIWMKENLNVSHYRNGDIIPEVQDRTAWAVLTTGAWSYYENDSGNGTLYGKLYNWYVVNDSRGLAPVGWHVPSNTEWTILIDYLGGETVAGEVMKTTTNWIEPYSLATNSSGFAGLPGGSRSGDFYGIGMHANWWTSTNYGFPSAWSVTLDNYQNVVNTYNFFDHTTGFSVRCIKD